MLRLRGPRSLELSLSLSMHEPMLSLSLIMLEPMLSLSTLLAVFGHTFLLFGPGPVPTGPKWP